MKTVIYNPNDIDAILTAALLQTMGWTSFASNEVVNVNEGRFIWLGVVPTKNHFPLKKKPEAIHRNPSPNNETKLVEEVRHSCYIKGANVRYVQHLLLPGVLYPDQTVDLVDKDVHQTSYSKTTLLDQVSSVEGIDTPSRHFLNYLITSFYNKQTTVEDLAITVLNVVAALKALRSREVFTPIPTVEKGIINENLESGLALIRTLRSESERILAHAASFNDSGTSAGKRRIVRTYMNENWWFLRRQLLPTDLAFNICLSVTGVQVDATVDYAYELNLPDPVIIIS